MNDLILDIRNLSVEYGYGSDPVKVLRGVDLTLERGQVLGLAGESGCGKSTLAYAATRLLPPPGLITGGEVLVTGKDGQTRDLLRMNDEELRRGRWTDTAIVFQGAMNSLNPVYRVERQLTDAIKAHAPHMDARARHDRAAELLDMVGISADRLRSYPHQLSGGMRQRVMIAMAMLCRPKMIIADEATTALDATIQAQLLELLYEMVNEYKTALTMVTHNLGVVARYVHRINVMYAGSIVESGTVREIWANPMHPYTEGLLSCVPRLGQKLGPIKGMPPSLINRPDTCAFLPRCRHREQRCFTMPPGVLTHVEGSHYCTCPVKLEV